jgi:predicted RND superfamily exporter protein
VSDKEKLSASTWQRLIRRYVAFAFRRPITLIVLFTVMTVAATALAVSRLKVVTDLAELLPEGTVSVRALDESRKRIGSTDLFTIAIRSEVNDTAAVAALQAKLRAHILTHWKDAQWVQIGRDTSFFRQRALYFLPDDTLAKLKDYLERELDRYAAKSVPGIVDLDDDDDDDDNSASKTGAAKKGANKDKRPDWYDPDLPRRLGLPGNVAEQFNTAFETDKKKKGPKLSPKEKQRRALIRERLINEEGNIGVVLVSLEKPSSDLDYARVALKRGEALIAKLNPDKKKSNLTAMVVGAYRSFMEVEAVAGDGQTATYVSVGLVLGLMLLFFRSFRAVLIFLLPLVTAASLTMALTSVTYGRLTVITVFVLAMLAGMGIDYGVHLFGRVLSERRTGTALEDATHIAISETGKALFAAAVTTVVSLMALQFGHFEGFREFSVVAAYGLLFCVLTAMLMFPPLLALSHRIWAFRVADRSKIERWLGSIVDARSTRVLLFFGGIALTVPFGLYASSVQFEHNFRNLRAPKKHQTMNYGGAVGRNRSTSPGVILAQSEKQMRNVHQLLLDRLNKDKDPTLNSFITIATFLPAADVQNRRAKVIAEIRELVHKRAMNRAEGRAKKIITSLRTMSRKKPFVLKDLPPWSLRLVTERDGSTGKIGLLYAKIRNWDARSVRDFQLRYEQLSAGEGKKVMVASTRFILSDVVAMVKADGTRLLILVSIILLVILLAFSRSFVGGLVLLVSVGVGGLWTAGFMGIFDLRVGLYNVIVIPVILGVGVDAAIHLYHAQKSIVEEQLDLDGRYRLLWAVFKNVTASSWTTAVGFVGLLFISHKGLKTIGELGSVGIMLSWLAVVTILPLLLLPLERFWKKA